MTTLTRQLGPADHGLPMTLEEFLPADYREGSRYELIEGRLYVSPQPNVPHLWFTEFAAEKLREYKRAHPEVVNFVSQGSRVFVESDDPVTAPEPDIAAYADYPLERGPHVRWEELSPLVVVEVMGEGNPHAR